MDDSRGFLKFKLADVLFFHEGVIWLALAVATEIPPLVSPAGFSLLLFMLIDFLRRSCSLYLI